MPPPSKIKTKRLKEFARQKFPRDSVLREILLSEEDEMEVSTFIARLPVWLKLCNFLKEEG